MGVSPSMSIKQRLAGSGQHVVFIGLCVQTEPITSCEQQASAEPCCAPEKVKHTRQTRVHRHESQGLEYMQIRCHCGSTSELAMCAKHRGAGANMANTGMQFHTLLFCRPFCGKHALWIQINPPSLKSKTKNLNTHWEITFPTFIQ